MMFEDNEKAAKIDNITVEHAWVVLQLLDKSASQGILQPVEFEILGNLRKALVDGIYGATGKNFDEVFAQYRAAQMEQARAQSETANAQ